MARTAPEPLRRCVMCGEHLPKHQLLRVVRTPLGLVEVDTTRRKAGRGAYLCGQESCREQVQRKPARLERALRTTISARERERLAEAIQQLSH